MPVLRDIDDQQPSTLTIETRGLLDNIVWQLTVGAGGSTGGKPATAAGPSIDWTTIMIIGVIVLVIFLLMRK